MRGSATPITAAQAFALLACTGLLVLVLGVISEGPAYVTVGLVASTLGLLASAAPSALRQVGAASTLAKLFGKKI